MKYGNTTFCVDLIICLAHSIIYRIHPTDRGFRVDRVKMTFVSFVWLVRNKRQAIERFCDFVNRYIFALPDLN